MRHNEIEKGKSYAKVRQGREREVLYSAVKVTILDTTKRYATRRFYSSEDIRFVEFEPDSHAAGGSEHMLARIEGRWSRAHEAMFAANVKDPRIAVKPAELFMEWDAFLAHVVAKKESEKRAARARDEADRKRVLRWTAIADRLAPHAPESLTERIRKNAGGGPYRLRSNTMVDITLEELWALATSITPEPAYVCETCFLPVNQDDGSLFISEAGHSYCNDHYPDREPVDA